MKEKEADAGGYNKREEEEEEAVVGVSSAEKGEPTQGEEKEGRGERKEGREEGRALSFLFLTLSPPLLRVRTCTRALLQSGRREGGRRSTTPPPLSQKEGREKKEPRFSSYVFSPRPSLRLRRRRIPFACKTAHSLFSLLSSPLLSSPSPSPPLFPQRRRRPRPFVALFFNSQQ